MLKGMTNDPAPDESADDLPMIDELILDDPPDRLGDPPDPYDFRQISYAEALLVLTLPTRAVVVDLTPQDQGHHCCRFLVLNLSGAELVSALGRCLVQSALLEADGWLVRFAELPGGYDLHEVVVGERRPDLN